MNEAVLELQKQVQELKSNLFKQDVVITQFIEGQLANKNSKHNSKIQWLEQDILKLKNENSKQNEELFHLKKQLKSQELYTHDRLNSYQTKSFHKIQALNTTLSKHMEKMNTYVTFTAYATAYRDYNTDDVVLFDGLVVNSEFYNSTTSIFTCPYSGFYLFAVSVRVIADPMSVDIKLDGILLVSALARDDTSNDQGSVLVVTRCDEGQQVWISCRGDGHTMHGGSVRTSSFTGTLLRVI